MTRDEFNELKHTGQVATEHEWQDGADGDTFRAFDRSPFLSRNGEVFLPQDVLCATAIEILRLAAGVERLKKVADQAIELAGAKIDPHDPNWIDTNSVGDFTDHKPELAAYLQEREGS